MPEIAAAHRAAQRAAVVPGRRLDPMFAGGVALVAVAGLLVYPYASADESSHALREDERLGTRTTVVAVPTLSTVRESAVSAPALVEPLPRAPPPRAAKAVNSPIEGAQRSAPAVATPVPTTPIPEHEVAVGGGQGADPPAPPPEPPVPVDPWQTLRDALGACARSSGLWERATCEQGARLAHCDGYWGNVALCPSGRMEFGQ
jgi:hypothetical protein